jgi:putative ATP-grasp target RiPP
MFTTITTRPLITMPVVEDNPLSSASLRYLVRHPVMANEPGPTGTRPLGLRHARPVPPPTRPAYRYCWELQVAVDAQGRPLIETMSKDWKTKASSDGDEGPEEHYDWEEE